MFIFTLRIEDTRNFLLQSLAKWFIISFVASVLEAVHDEQDRSGCSEVWYRAWFGTTRPQVQVLSPGPHARVVELADSLDSGSSVHYARAGSSPASRTIVGAS